MEIPEERPAWLRKGLAVLGILVVVWTAMNVGNIENWLIEARIKGPTSESIEWLWTGQQNAMFDEMLRQLNDEPITNAEVTEALARESDAGSGYDGRYFLTTPGNRQQPRVVAYAAVRQIGDRLYFVAEFTNEANMRRAEVRGIGSVAGIATPMAPRENAGLKQGRRYVNGFGLALRRENGSYEVHAETDNDSETHVAIAYRVP